MTPVEGDIDIHIAIRNAHVTNARIDNRRNLAASRLLLDKPVQQALLLIPILFSLCSHAQLYAATHACEQALGITPDKTVMARRLALVRVENLREHLWRVLLDWPTLLGKPAATTHLQTLLPSLQRYSQQLKTGDALFVPGATLTGPFTLDKPEFKSVQDALIKRVETDILGMKLETWQQLESTADFSDWLRSSTTPAAKLLQHCLQQDWQCVGQTQVPNLTASELQSLSPQLKTPGFIAAPTSSGLARATGFDVDAGSPLLKASHQAWGNGLLTRLLARIDCIVRLTSALTTAPSVSIHESCCSTESGTGIGIVSAARGLLLHRVELEQGHIRDYRILAPTEWNFHPDGVVAQSIRQMQGSTAAIEQQTRMLINAVDPCVGYRLHISEGESAHARNVAV